MQYRINGLSPMNYKGLKMYLVDTGMIEKNKENKYYIKNKKLPLIKNTKKGQVLAKQKVKTFDSIDDIIKYLVEIGTIHAQKGYKALEDLPAMWANRNN